MKKYLIAVALLATTCASKKLEADFPTGGSGGDKQSPTSFSKREVEQAMRKVADWQIAHQSEVKHSARDWTNATLYLGMAGWAELSGKTIGDETYYDWLKAIGDRYKWKAAERMYHADDLAILQMYIEMFRRYGDRAMLEPAIERIDWIMEHPSQGSLIINYSDQTTLERWSWCDALFMAPPIFAKLHRITGDAKYMRFMDAEYRCSYDFLYDRKEKMFYRDSRYFHQKEANGQKVFWGRGNGWVLGGLVEILKELPREDKYRGFYEELFVEMCGRMTEIQQPDGFWHASLLDPVSYPSPETSATAFIVYALAYGVNEDILDRAVYLPAITKSWKGLKSVINAEGKLGYVQPVGADPQKVTMDMTEVYGVGAFLLAGSEMYKLANN